MKKSSSPFEGDAGSCALRGTGQPSVSERKRRRDKGHLRSGLFPEPFVAAKKFLDAEQDSVALTGLPNPEIRQSFPHRSHPGCRRRRLHSPRAERMNVTPPIPPSAQSVQTKKKPPVDLAISA